MTATLFAVLLPAAPGGWVHLSGIDQGKPFVQNARFADTWARRNGRWYVVFTAVALAERP